MIGKLIGGIVIFVVLVGVWNFPPIKRRYYLLRSKAAGSKVRWSIKFQFGLWKWIRWLIRTTIDLVVFWVVWIWNDGTVWLRIKDLWIKGKARVAEIGTSILAVGQKAVEAIVYITPFGREAAADADFRYCLIVFTICVAISCVLFIHLMKGLTGTVTNVILCTIAAFAMWYVCFGVCFLLVLIPFWFKVLAALVAIAVSVLLFFVFGILVEMIEEAL